MIVDTNKCDEKPSDFALVVDRDSVDLSSRNISLSAPVDITFRVVRRDWLITISGAQSVDFTRRCDRCFKTVSATIDLEFLSDYVLLEDLNDENESSMEDRGIEYAVLESNLVDLKTIFADQFLVEVADVFVCSEDCKGMCGECGKPLKGDECECGDQGIDPRWAALKDLKKGN